MTQRALDGLVQVRARREELTLRELHAAGEAARRAQVKLEERRRQVNELVAQITEHVQRPFRDSGKSMVSARELQLVQSRLELLREKLRRAREIERAAQADLEMAEGLRAEALRRHLVARTRHQTAADQVQRARRAQSAQTERVALETAQEQAIRAAAAGR